MVLKKIDANPVLTRFIQQFTEGSRVNAHLQEEITDYLLGDSNVCPPIQQDSGFYTYAALTELERLEKRGDERMFYRAAEVLYRSCNHYHTKKYVIDRCFLDDVQLREVSAVKLDQSGNPLIISRLKATLEQLGAATFQSFLRKYIEEHNANAKQSYTSVLERARLLLLATYVYQVSPSLLDEVKDIMDPIYYHVITGNSEAYKQELRKMAESICTHQLTKHNSLTHEVVEPAIIKEKTKQTRQKYFPDSPDNGGKVLNKAEFLRYVELFISLVHYRLHKIGDREQFRTSADVYDRELLRILDVLFEVIPLDLLTHDQRLNDLVNAQEPYWLLLMFHQRLISSDIPWAELEELALHDIGHSRRVLDLAGVPIIKGYLYKTLRDHLPDQSNVDESIAQIALQSLRQFKGTLKLSSFLEDRISLEEALPGVEFNDMQRLKQRMVTLSFLPSDHPLIAKLVMFVSHYIDKTDRLVGYNCFAYAFQDRLAELVNLYQHDSAVKIEPFIHQVLVTKGNHYYYTDVQDEAYIALITSHPKWCLARFDSLEADVRMFVLQTILTHDQTQNAEIRREAIMRGMSDASKKVSNIAIAEFARAKDPELYLHVYTTEKKAKLKELALEAISQLENSKELFHELLMKETNKKLITLIESMLDTQEQGADMSFANLSNLVDKRKLARIKWVSYERFPPLADQAGQTLGVEVIEYMLTHSFESPTEPNSRVMEVLSRVDRSSLAIVAVELLNAWIDNAAPAKEKWVMPLCVAMGDRRIVDILGHQIKEWTDGSRGALASDAVRALSFTEDLAALRLIDQVKRTVKNRQVKNAAEEALSMAAANLNITADELEDRLITQLGFDASGKQQFDYGDRTFTVKINNELELEVINDSTGKVVKSLPAPTQKDDQDLAQLARTAFSQLKKDLKSMVKIQTLRLEESLSKSRFWSASAWKRLFVENVLMQKFAIGLIWGVYENGTLTDTFRYMDDGTFNTVDEEEYELADDASQIGLVHSLELDEETLTAWRTQLEDYEISQPFEQMNRQSFVPTEEELNRNEILRLPEESYTPTSFAGTMEKLGWVKGRPQDAGFYYEFYKVYGDMVAELRISGASITYYDGMEDITLESLVFYPNEDGRYMYYEPNKRVNLSQIPPRVFSETVYDVLRAAGK